MPPSLPLADRFRDCSHALLRRLHPRRKLIVARLKGDLDAASVQHTDRVLRTALRDAPKALEIDLSRVTHLSPEGTLPLFLTAHGARGQGITLTVTHAPDQARTVMRRMGLERYLSAGGSGQ
ncbi:hypothetical protein GCM10010222_44590 [Streptomyces tanashiensis]|uniref:STAS domain-containing protein n=1 Tax=Streptomyces tanashiensis TaxID=67367 RepID=UPI0016737956|nr:STAS domain-containing protein [Streptomyces tanashiensis]GGS97959.1 hypothetical protein GCM10010222_44590 [Streptomyces tanashiensis]